MIKSALYKQMDINREIDQNAVINIGIEQAITIIEQIAGDVDIDKQIPKKIIYRKQKYGTPWLCPVCESDQIKIEFFSTDGSQPEKQYSYCSNCGQKLDWSEVCD